MKPICPKCGGEIDPEDVNMSKGAIFCRACEEIFPLDGEDGNAAFDGGFYVPDDFDIENPPKGVTCEQTAEGVKITINARTLLPLLFLIPFALVWSGGSLGGIYGTQFSNGFDLVQSLFGIPFLIGSIVLWSIILFLLAGKVVIKLSPIGCSVFTGVGRLGRTKRFDAVEVSGVDEETRSIRTGNGGSRTSTGIYIRRSAGDISLGGTSNETRRRYVLYAMRSLISALK